MNVTGGSDAFAKKTKSRKRERRRDVEELQKNMREASDASNEVSALLRAEGEKDDR